MSLLAYTTVRAATTSITHDEANTYFNFVDIPVYKCFYSAECWGDANNHLLNTFLIQQTTAIFGMTELGLRLPALLSHLFYLLFSGLLLLRLTAQSAKTEKLLLVLSGFLLLNLNPYLLEFFSLARGYGLGMGFIMASVYFLCIDKPWLAFISAGLAVLANFVYLNFLACLVVVYLFQWWLWSDRNFRQLLPPAGVSLVLAILLFKPISILIGKGEFDFGAASLGVTIYEIFADSLMGEIYFKQFNHGIIQTSSLVLIGLGTIGGLLRLRKGKATTPHDKAWLLLSILLLLNVAAMIVQNWLLGVQYLVDRKSIYLITLMVLPVWMMAKPLFSSWKPLQLLPLVLALASLTHFSRTASTTAMREWYYEVPTKEAAEDVFASGNLDHIGVFWTYRPSISFYIQMEGADMPMTVIEAGELASYSRDGWLYVEHHQIEAVPAGYELIKKYGYAAALFRKN